MAALIGERPLEEGLAGRGVEVQGRQPGGRDPRDPQKGSGAAATRPLTTAVDARKQTLTADFFDWMFGTLSKTQQSNRKEVRRG